MRLILKHLCALFLFLGFEGPIFAQTMRYDWTIPIGGNNIEDAKDVAIASDNSIYAIGQFASTVDFDPSSATQNLTATNSSGYIAHYAANSTLINVIALGGTGTSNCNSVELDDSNNVYISGNFSGSIDFDPSVNNSILNSNGTSDLFIAKYSSNFQLIWVKQFGGTLNVFSTDLEYKNKRLYANGRFNGLMNFSPSITYTSSGLYDIFALCLNKQGNLLWAKSIGNVGSEDSRSICADDNNNVYLSGSFTGTLDVNPSATAISNIVSNGTNGGDVFILKLDSLGNYIWVRTLNGGGAEFIFDIKTYNSFLYVNGGFSWTVDFDPSANYDTLSNLGGLDAFAWQLDLNGNHNWVRRVGNANTEFYDGRTIAFSKAGKPYFLGIFEGSANFNSNGNNVMTSNGVFDVYVWALEPNGNYRWSQSFGGTDNDVGLGISTDHDDNIVITGFFRNTVDFNPWSGTDIISVVPPVSSNSPDAFICKWRVCESTNTITVNSCKSSYTWNNQTYTVPGTYIGQFLNIDSCDSTVVMNLNFNNINNSTTVVGQTISSNQNGATYQWYNCENWSILGNAFQQQFTANQGGSFLSIINYNGCTDTTACVTINPLSIANVSEYEVIKLYPNPTNGKLNVSSDLEIVNTILFSIDNRTLLQIKGKINEIDLSKLSSGTYYIVFNLNDNRRVVQSVCKW